MTRNSKVVLGVAAGVAALAVAGMYAKKKGYLNNINANSLKNGLGGLKDTAMKAFGGSKSSDMGMSNSNSGNSMNMSSESTGSSTNGSSKRKGSSSSMNSGMGNINPATT